MSQAAEFGSRNNPYQSSSTATLDSPRELPLEEQVAALQAFVGPRAEFYLRKWAPRLLDPSGETGMNWAAFFLTSFWFGYRKMYAAVAIYFGVVMLLAILLQVVFVGILKLDILPPGVNLIMNLMVSIVCGLCANSWYLAHAQRAINKARAQGLEDEHLHFVLERQGGTSLLAAFGLTFVVGVIFVAVFVVLGVFVAVMHGLPHPN